ncbi:hypothetical protein EDF56_101524 [Novosphingobium sp. PhB165]|nr:hypothetical protein EDF56_101524 [Novosphingobium sp. PhB165]
MSLRTAFSLRHPTLRQPQPWSGEPASPETLFLRPTASHPAHPELVEGWEQQRHVAGGFDKLSLSGIKTMIGMSMRPRTRLCRVFGNGMASDLASTASF